MAILKSYVECLRFAQFGNWLEEYCWTHHIEILDLHSRKGLLRETVFYKLDADEDILSQFQKNLNFIMNEYNSR